MSRRAATTGTWPLVRAIVRRDRVRIALWTIGMTAMVALSIESVRSVFPTQADLDAAAQSSRNPAVLAFQGPDIGLDTLGGQVAFQIGAPGLVFMAIMALLMTGRLTRAEEEAGRFELVRSLPVGRDAPLTAAAIVVGAMSLAIGIGITVASIVGGLPVAGSVDFGVGYALTGALFAAVTLVTAQVTENSRLANGLAGVVLGAAFVLRAIGDQADGALASITWLSPLGWVQRGARPFADERWWPLGLTAVVAAALVAVAVRLENRRDLGAGLVPPRPGPATGSPRLAGPLPLAVRLQRGAVVGWTAGTAFLALVYGAVTSAIESFVRDNPDLAEFLQAVGGNLTDAYLATAARTVALIGSGFAVQSALRLRSEETDGRIEPLLATQVPRSRIWSAHLVVALAGSAIVLATSGLVLGVAAAIAVGDGSLVLRSLGATIVYLPASAVLIGVALAATGVAPRATAIAWAALVAGFVVAMFGPLLDLPTWAMRISPFEHLERVPAEHLTVGPISGLTVVAALLCAAGAIGFRRRDVSSA